MVPMCLSQVNVTTSTSRFCEGLWPLPYDHAVPCSGERGHSLGDIESRLQMTSAHPQIRMLNGIGLLNCTKFATFLLAIDHIVWYDCPSGTSSYPFRSISAIWLRLKHEKATARTNIAKRPDLRKNKHMVSES